MKSGIAINKCVNVGMTKIDGVARPVFVYVKYEGDANKARLSITGVEGPRSHGEAYGSSGACVHSGHNWTFDASIDGKRLVEIAERWHLNDMRAGCLHQRFGYRNHQCLDCKATWSSPLSLSKHTKNISGEPTETCHTCLSANVEASPVVPAWNFDEEIELVTYKLTRAAYAERTKLQNKILDTVAETRRYVATVEEQGILKLQLSLKRAPDADGVESGRYEVEKRETRRACWVPVKEHPRGLLSKRCSSCGYAYGSSWLYEQVPDDVIEFLLTLPDHSEQLPAAWKRICR